MRTPEQKLATKLRKAAERKAHRKRVFLKHPPAVRLEFNKPGVPWRCPGPGGVVSNGQKLSRTSSTGSARIPA